MLNKFLKNKLKKQKFSHFLFQICSYVENILYPARYDVSLFVDTDKFWRDASELVDKYLPENDYFKEMINHQLRNNLRHTMNLNKLKKNRTLISIDCL